MRGMGLGVCAGKIVDKLSWELPHADRSRESGQIGDWAIEVISPHWRRTRDLLGELEITSMQPYLNFQSFLTAYLALMTEIFRYGEQTAPDFTWRSQYAIKDASWQAIRQQFGPTPLSGAAPSWRAS